MQCPTIGVEREWQSVLASFYDDIDRMIALNAEGYYYNEFADRIEIYVPDSAFSLKLLCFDNINLLKYH
jgi:hypothetical protein